MAGWRLRSYFILDPLIWLYTLVMGLLAIPGAHVLTAADGGCTVFPTRGLG